MHEHPECVTTTVIATHTGALLIFTAMSMKIRKAVLKLFVPGFWATFEKVKYGEEGQDWFQVLTQLAAVRSALTIPARWILKDSCAIVL